MKKIRLSAAIALCLVPGAALACDDHVGKCEIEAWRWHSTGHYLTVDGAATCDSGFITIRLYEGEGKEAAFLGVATGVVEGHAFEAIATRVSKPTGVSIKYSIDPS